MASGLGCGIPSEFRLRVALVALGLAGGELTIVMMINLSVSETSLAMQAMRMHAY